MQVKNDTVSIPLSVLAVPEEKR